jgi:hypothetical protein
MDEINDTIYGAVVSILFQERTNTSLVVNRFIQLIDGFGNLMATLNIKFSFDFSLKTD